MQSWSQKLSLFKICTVGGVSFFLLSFSASDAKRGIAIVGHPSVRPSQLAPTEHQRYRRTVGWVTLKVIARIISLCSSEPSISSLRGTPQNSSGIGVGSLFSAESLQYLWNGARQDRFKLMTNRKLHTRFRLVPKSTTLDDLERPLYTPLHKTCVRASFGAHHENLNEDRHTVSAA